MRKLFIATAVFLAFSGLAKAAVYQPHDYDGSPVNTIDFVGALPCLIDSSTGTNAVLCGSIGRGIVLGVMSASVTATQYLVLRDSATANVTSTTSTVVFASGASAGANTSVMWKFPVPIQFQNGISVNASAAPAGTSTWIILYRPLKSTE